MTTEPAVKNVTSTAPTPYLDLVAATRPARQYKHELLSALCIGAGDRVPDVGCGPATDLAALAEEVGRTIRNVRNVAAVLTDFDTAETILGLRRNTDRAVVAGYLTPKAGRAWLDHLTRTETFFATSSLITVLAAA